MSALQFLDSTPTFKEVEKRTQDLRDDDQLSVTSRLPDEILSLLFEYVSIALACKRSHPRELLPVSQVCRHWRDVALSTPRMWSYIASTERKIAELFLGRTKSVPIHLLSRNKLKDDTTVKLVLAHCHRLKTIELRGCSTQLSSFVSQLQLPLLERLTLVLGCNIATSGRFATSVDPDTIPPLRFVSLKNIIFNSNEHVFSHLQILKVRFDSAYAAFMPIPNLFRLLGHLNRLETLELDNVAIRSTEEPSDDARVHVPRLTSISMHVCDISGLSILTRLSYPRPFRSIKVQVKNHVSRDDLAPVASAFYAMVPTPANHWRVEIQSDSRPSGLRDVRVSIWPGPSESVESEIGESPFRICIVGPRDFEADFMLCSLLPPSARINLTLGHPHVYADVRLDDLYFPSLPSPIKPLHAVEELHIDSLEVLLAILSDTPEANHQSPLPPFSLPLLRNIRVTGSGWRHKGTPATWTKLALLLGARQNVNAGIDTLEIPSYSPMLDIGEIELLKKCVTNFQYGGTHA